MERKHKNWTSIVRKLEESETRRYILKEVLKDSFEKKKKKKKNAFYSSKDVEIVL